MKCLFNTDNLVTSVQCFPFSLTV